MTGSERGGGARRLGTERGSDERREYLEFFARQARRGRSPFDNQCPSSFQPGRSARPEFAAAAWRAGYATASSGIRPAADGSVDVRCLSCKQRGDGDRSARPGDKQVQRSENGDGDSLRAVLDGGGNRCGEELDGESRDAQRKEIEREVDRRVCVPFSDEFDAVGFVGA